GGGGAASKALGAMQAKKIANSESLKAAAKEGEDKADKTKKEDFSAMFSLYDEAQKPLKDVKYEIQTNDEQIHEGKTNSNGETAEISGYTKADCKVRFFNGMVSRF
ncbi:MAG TPA: hypothetical protein PKE30_15995, partial [Niabella sp.]|nr:hypothetical protein [Niabella sp.]